MNAASGPVTQGHAATAFLTTPAVSPTAATFGWTLTGVGGQRPAREVPAADPGRTAWRWLLWIALLALLAFIPTALAAQIQPLDPFQRTVAAQLRSYEEQLEVEGLTHAVYMGSLEDGSTETLTVDLEEGVNYLILGVCDQDCDDLDLALYQGSSLVDEDLETDDFPIVQVEPTADRTYRLRITMASCEEEPCRYGIAVYERE